MKIKTSELIGAALDWAVAKCGLNGRKWDKVHFGNFRVGCGKLYLNSVVTFPYSPSTDWAQGGPIIEREGISITRCDDEYGTDRKGFTTNKRIPVWGAAVGQQSREEVFSSQGDHWGMAYSIYEDGVVFGSTPLIAGMRSYVASKLGDEVDVPDELTKEQP